MTALELYNKLQEGSRREIACKAVVLAGHPVHTDFGDVIDHEDHPALVEAMRSWWHCSTTPSVVELLEAYSDKRPKEMAIVLCAESVSSETTHPSIVECCRTRIAWVLGQASAADRTEALEMAWRLANSTTMDVDWQLKHQAIAAGCTSIKQAAESAAKAVVLNNDVAFRIALACLAHRIRTLFPDPCNMNHLDAMTRWSSSVASGRRMMTNIRDGYTQRWMVG